VAPHFIIGAVVADSRSENNRTALLRSNIRFTDNSDENVEHDNHAEKGQEEPQKHHRGGIFVVLQVEVSDQDRVGSQIRVDTVLGTEICIRWVQIVTRAFDIAVGPVHDVEHAAVLVLRV